MTTFSLCTIISQETRSSDVEDWITFHRVAGFDSFFFYDCSMDNQWQYLEIGSFDRIKVIPSHQQEIDFSERFKNENDRWIAFIESNELIVLKKHDTIQEFIQEICPQNHGAIQVNRSSFGTKIIAHLSSLSSPPIFQADSESICIINARETENPSALAFRKRYQHTYLVTAASQNHFKSLLQFLSTAVAMSPCFVWDLGLDQESVAQLQSIKKNIIYHKFDYSCYPDHYNIHIKNGEYAWKPALIKETMQEILSQNENQNHDIVLVWCDAGNMLIDKSLPSLTRVVHHNKLYSPTSMGIIEQLTHPKTLEYLETPMDAAIVKRQNRNGALFGFLISDKEIQDLIVSFDHYARDKSCIAPEGSNRENHRQDQAIFSILFYRFFDAHPDCVIHNVLACKIHCDCD